MSRWDRAWLFLLGLLSASLGGVVLAWHRWVNPGRRIVGEPFAGWVDEPWFPLAVAGLGLILALAGLGWLISQFRRNRDLAARFDAGGGPIDAPVSIRSRQVADAVAEQAELLPGVLSAASRVISDAPPTVELRLVVDGGADLAALTSRLDERVRAGLRRTLGRPDAALIVRFGLKQPKTGVVDGGTLVGPPDPAPDQPGSAHQQRHALPHVKLPQVVLHQPTLPLPILPLPTTTPGGPAGHSAESSAATSSGTSTLA